jgi:uncharacterized protein (TIGR02453 family)
MLQNDVLKFLKELKKNNNKAWFEKNKPRYVNAQNELKGLIADWIKLFSKTEPAVAHLDPAKCIFRIYRDVRFSTDKSPYKNNLGAYLSPSGKNSDGPGYYLHVEPGNCFFGAGVYMPMPENLPKIRQEIDYNFAAFKKILNAKKFRNNFPELNTELKLKKTPKGYDENNPAIEFLKLKSFVVFKKLKDEDVLSKDLPKALNELSKIVHPFNMFLKQAMN